MNDEKLYGFADYSFCPLTKKCCVERKCAWWIEINNKGGCAIRALGALPIIAQITAESDKP
jgi:hypothetical protein